MMRSTLLNALVILALGLLGGWLFQLLHVPLAWTLGSMAAAAAVAIGGAPWRMPAPVRDLVRPVVGVLAGSALSPETLASLLDLWSALAFVLLFVLASSICGWLFFRRVARLDRVTAFFAATPGGLSEMTLLGDQLGGNLRSLVLIHATRILVVIFTLPLLLQWVLGADLTGTAQAMAPRPVHSSMWDGLILLACGILGFGVGRIRGFPGGVLVAAMLFSGVVHGAGWTDLAPPAWMLAVVQVVVGTIAGSRFIGVTWIELRLTALWAAVWAFVLVVLAIGAAALSAAALGQPLVQMLLALAPGGMTEMIVITYALGIDAFFVILCQIVRTLLVSVCTPIAAHWCGIGKRPRT